MREHEFYVRWLQKIRAAVVELLSRGAGRPKGERQCVKNTGGKVARRRSPLLINGLNLWEIPEVVKKKK
jgi:hypothetical protein